MNNILKSNEIVIVVYDYGWNNGGAGSVALQNALTANSLGYETIFFCMAGPVDKQLSEAGVRVVCLDQKDLINDKNKIRAAINGIWNVSVYNAMNSLLSEFKNKKILVHIHGFSHGLSASVFKACKYKAKVVLHLHEYASICPNGGLFNFKRNTFCSLNPMSVRCFCSNCDSRSFIYKIYRIIKQIPLKKWILENDELFCVYISEFSKQKIKNHLKSNNFYYIHNPVADLGYICNEFRKKEMFLYLGRISPEKGIDLFCEAVDQLNKKGIVIGGGEKLQEYKKKYPSIQFIGWVDKKEITKYLSDVKCLVMASRCYETDGLAVQELLKCRIPCIVPKESASSDYINDKKNGILYKSGSLESLKESMKRIDEITGEFEDNYFSFTDDIKSFYKYLFSKEFGFVEDLL